MQAAEIANSSAGTMAFVCVFLPLVAFFLGFVVFRRQTALAIGINVVAALASAACSVMLFLGGPIEEPIGAEWLTVGSSASAFGFYLDGLSLVMGMVVAVIAACIQLYSVSYMSHDPGRARFFSCLGLFTWSMLAFVYAASLLQAFIFWELVGLASFLLIGFWFEKPSAVAAAKKAFLMTRIGDVGLFIGLILLLRAAGTLDIATINQPETVASMGDQVGLITLLLFVGIVGKSAQFPLHTWLPDAMEGPTPVSALLHSATMVAAGVFLFARFHPVFMAAPSTLEIVLIIAAFTAVLSSTMAMVAQDMKRVLAFSSISQLGYMLMGLAAGGLFAGFFHLTTHAVFKALLFLCAGAYIHHHGTNDMVAMGRDGARKLPVVTLGLIAGGAALAGIPPLAGFWSKEAILYQVGSAGSVVAQVGGYLAALMTAYYTFRMIFLIIRPSEDSQAVAEEAAGAQFGDGHHDDHGHGAPWPMRVPILLLTVGAVVLGFAGDAFGDFLGLEVVHASWAEMAPAIGVALFGVLWAWFDFGRSGAAQTGFLHRMPGLEALLKDRWRIDAFYGATFIRLAPGLASACFGVERSGMDGSADAVGTGTIKTAEVTARSQTGRLQIYVGTAVVVVTLLSFYVSYR